MLEAFTISSDSRFHTLMILTEKKSARAFTLEFGTKSLNELPPSVILTWLIVKKITWVYQQNDVFCSTLASSLVDVEALNVHYII